MLKKSASSDGFLEVYFIKNDKLVIKKLNMLL